MRARANVLVALLLVLLSLAASEDAPSAARASAPRKKSRSRRRTAAASAAAAAAADASVSSAVSVGGARCPFEDEGWTPQEMSGHLTALVPEGRLAEAHACARLSMSEVTSGRAAASAEELEALRLNDDILAGLVAPKARGVKRIYHNVLSLPSGFPDNSSDPLPPPPKGDPAIMVWDNALSEAQCVDLIDLFERSEHYEGNLMYDGKIKVQHDVKKASEFDISDTAATSPEWLAVDRVLLSTVTRLLASYEVNNSMIRLLKNPLDDEGFRMKRYRNDGTEHHAYHADSGQEPPGAPRRIIAVLIYLNEVEVGGETVFLRQGLAIKPKCGRVLFFPTAFPYVHAGRRPVSSNKYVCANFITLPQV